MIGKVSVNVQTDVAKCRSRILVMGTNIQVFWRQVSQ